MGVKPVPEWDVNKGAVLGSGQIHKVLMITQYLRLTLCLSGQVVEKGANASTKVATTGLEPALGFVPIENLLPSAHS